MSPGSTVPESDALSLAQAIEEYRKWSPRRSLWPNGTPVAVTHPSSPEDTAALARLYRELLVGLAWAWARVGSPAAEHERIPSAAWRYLRHFSTKHSVAREDEALGGRTYYDIRIKHYLNPEIDPPEWEYFDDAALWLAKENGISLETSVGFTKSSIYLEKVLICYQRAEGIVPYRDPIGSIDDIAISLSTIFPGYDHVWQDLSINETQSIERMRLHYPSLISYFLQQERYYTPSIIQELLPLNVQVTKEKAFTRVAKAFESLPPDIRDGVWKRGGRKRAADEIRKVHPDIKDVDRVLRELLNSEKRAKPEG